MCTQAGTQTHTVFFRFLHEVSDSVLFCILLGIISVHLQLIVCITALLVSKHGWSICITITTPLHGFLYKDANSLIRVRG